MPSSSPSPAPRRRGRADARHLPRRAGAERRARRHAASARRGHRQIEIAAADPARHVAPGSRWPPSPARRCLEVNSFHHQAVDALGAGLRVVAQAADGTVEAIEDPSRSLFLGVQWHAETLTQRPEHAALFAA
jgi:gamma-glutamyl-gamma-aminobutyrate hydrolase PuuD